MQASKNVTECRAVRDFDSVALRLDNTVTEVVVKQGDTESLIISGRSDVLSRVRTEVRDGQLAVTLGGSWSEKLQRALDTSLTRQTVRCDLTVRKLKSIEFGGLVRAHVSRLQCGSLSVSVCGAGRVNLSSLTADSLNGAMRGTCQLQVAGKVREQSVSIEGMGYYNARKLESRSAAVSLKGAGRATVWAVEDLSVRSVGMGSVEYYGAPRVKTQASPMASVMPASAAA